MTKARKIRFTTVQHCPKLDTDRMFKLFKQIKRLYGTGGLSLEHAYLDR